MFVKRVLIFFLLFILVVMALLFSLYIINTRILNSNRKGEQKKERVEIPRDKESCEKQGGRWGRIGIMPKESCNLPTKDAGKICSDSNECEGACIAELAKEDYKKVWEERRTIRTKGKCTPWVIVVGCQARVQNGKVKGILCVD